MVVLKVLFFPKQPREEVVGWSFVFYKKAGYSFFQEENEMKKTGSVLLLWTLIFCFFGNCFARETKPEKQYYFFGENNQFLAEVTTGKTTIRSRIAPKIPDEISRDDALRLWEGEKVAPEKNCEQDFLSFTNGVYAIKKCKEIVAKLAPTKKEPLNISVKKTLTTENSVINLWLIVGIGGMFAIAIIFVSRGAPARFMAEYCGAITCFTTIVIVIRLFFDVGGWFFAFILMTYLSAITIHKELVTRWIEIFPNLDSYKNQLIGGLLQVWGMMISPVIFFFIPKWISKTTVGIDFVWFITSWSILVTMLVVVANQFPIFRQKYLDWL